MADRKLKPQSIRKHHTLEAPRDMPRWTEGGDVKHVLKIDGWIIELVKGVGRLMLRLSPRKIYSHARENERRVRQVAKGMLKPY